MATQELRDWTLVLGFDGAEVQRGIAKVQKQLNKLKMPSINPLGGGVGGVTGGMPGSRPLGSVGISQEQPAGTSTTRRTSTSTTRTPKSTSTPPDEDSLMSLTASVENFRKKTVGSFKEGSSELATFNGQVNTLKEGIGKATSVKQVKSLRQGFKDLKVDTQILTKSLRDQERQLNASSMAAKGFSSSLKNLGRSFVSIFAIIEGGRAIFKAGKELDSLKASMLAASGSSEEAATNMQFVKDSSQELGIELIAAGKGYTKIGAAAKGANLDTKQTQEIFLAAAEASRTFGLNAERTNLVMLAFSQILSKGKVSQEELRRQLGEQLPGVMNIAAKAMNVTTGELERMIKAGLPATEFMTKFAKEMRKTVRVNGALAASMDKVEAVQQRMTNSFSLLADAVFNAGAANLLKGVFDGIAGIIDAVTFSVNALGVVIGGLNTVVNAVVEALQSFLGISIDTEAQLNVVTVAVKGLAILLGLKLAKGLKIAAFSATVATGSMTRFARSLNLARIAAKALLRALGIGFALEAGSFLLDKFVFNTEEDSSSSGGSTNITNNTTNRNELSFEVTGATGEEIARAAQKALAESLASSPDTAGQ